jgi:hypothetical protein
MITRTTSSPRRRPLASTHSFIHSFAHQPGRSISSIDRSGDIDRDDRSSHRSIGRSVNDGWGRLDAATRRTSSKADARGGG